MYIKRDLYLTKTPFKITYEFKWLPIQGIYCVQTGSCSNYDGKFKSVGCNKFTKLQLGKVSVILGKERILSFPRKGVVCNWERFQSFWERKGSFPFPQWSKGKLRKGKGKERIQTLPYFPVCKNDCIFA